MTHQIHLHPCDSPLYVVTVVTNYARFRSRVALYKAFEKHVEDSGAILYTVEIAFGERPFCVTQPSNPRHIQFRTIDEVWHKENALNLAISRLPQDWRYVAWIDADVVFARPDWVDETVHQLQHYQVIQMFSHAQDLSHEYHPLTSFTGFMYSYVNSLLTGEDLQRAIRKSGYSGGYGPGKTGTFWHPGYAWAATREAINMMGGLLDFAVLGSADHHMATALIGRPLLSVHEGMHPNYKMLVEQWAEGAALLKKDVGYMDGLLLHNWHGKKKDRRYVDRWKILVDNQFDPIADLRKDSQCVWQLTDRNIRLRDQVRAYFRQRNEDSIDR